MKLSPESLEAFTQAASLGSFSAAARRLGKSQSTVSEAIARLEIDLGVTLFDRSAKSPMLSEAGQGLLRHANSVLAAAEQLQQAAHALSAGLEPRLTLVLSDAYQSAHYSARLREMAERFPELEFECIFAEHEDIVSLISSGRGTLGLLPSAGAHPPEIGRASVSERAEFALYVANEHPLAKVSSVDLGQLGLHRALRLNTLNKSRQSEEQTAGSIRSWSAPNYLILLDLAVLGFGWASLPRWLVDNYAAGRLTQLNAPGWPRQQALEVIWSRQRPLGPAASWLRESLLTAP
ncbi:LysR family transcriptional regulator [Halopseudomonas pachastrellae]|uniref:LysR family transcriptional regulator n=1 Tax=Halopseudomonas pachastrellae TaxID=254161 RepID=UPI003D7E86B8|tara:strand:- start:482 stop:1357 length:876 start_codon:yes stop_codon:yes gene_type:complete